MKLIPLGGKRGEGKYAIVDDYDYHWLSTFTFHLDGAGYPSTRPNDKLMRLHQMLLPPKLPLHVDHINRDRLDNRRANLRYVTHGDNLRNSPPKCDSGYKGVYLRSQHTHAGRPWTARVKWNGVYYHLGSFASKEEAAAAMVEFWDAPEGARLPTHQDGRTKLRRKHAGK